MQIDMNKIQSIVDDDGIIFLSYGGYLSQTLISGMTEVLEKEAEESNVDINASNKIFTIFIELSQNMMHYSKSMNQDDDSLRTQGLILVTRDNDMNYSIRSQNIISLEDKNKIEPKLKEVVSLDKDDLKKRYRELRKSGQHTHGRGGGIGFYEIARKCNSIEYDFSKINENRYYFHIKTTIITKKDK